MNSIVSPEGPLQVESTPVGCPNCGEHGSGAVRPHSTTAVRGDFACPNGHLFILIWDRGAA